MPSIVKKNIETVVTEEVKKVEEPTTYKMQIAVRSIEDDAYQLLSKIASHGIQGFIVNCILDNGTKYEIIYGGKVTKAEAKEIFNRIKHLADLELMLIE